MEIPQIYTKWLDEIQPDVEQHVKMVSTDHGFYTIVRLTDQSLWMYFTATDNYYNPKRVECTRVAYTPENNFLTVWW